MNHPNSDIRDELNTLSPLLKDLHGKAPAFKVDASYFASMQEKVLEESRTNVHPKVLRISPWRIGIAASLVLCISATWYFWSNASDVTSPNTLAALQEIPVNDIDTYVDQYIDDIDLELFQVAVKDHLLEGDDLDTWDKAIDRILENGEEVENAWF